MRFWIIGAAALAAGCVSEPHNNVLLFGTDTKVALDVSSAATSGGAPQITLGYRRAEAVWMPLVVNRRVCDANGVCRTITGGPDDEPQLLQGEYHENGQGVDSYSVLASFGAKFESEASTGAAKAGGGLAQFFATGLAAQKLAGNSSVVNALKVNNGAAARAEADALASRVELTKAEQEKIVAEQAAIAANANTIATKIVAQCGGPEAGSMKWQNAVNNSGITSATGKSYIIAAPKNTEAINRIAEQSNYYSVFEKNLATACP